MQFFIRLKLHIFDNFFKNIFYNKDTKKRHLYRRNNYRIINKIRSLCGRIRPELRGLKFDYYNNVSLF